MSARALLLIALLGVCVAPSRANLIITPVWDSSITNDPNGASIESAINQAIGVFQSTYSTPITVSIYFQEASSGLGGSLRYQYAENYQSYYNALVSLDANPAAVAGLTANGGNAAVDPILGNWYIGMNSANLRAIGANVLPGCDPTGSAGAKTCTFGVNSSAVDGIVSLNTGITFPAKPNNGQNYSLVSVAEHEIDEILGLGSGIRNDESASGTATGSYITPEDLFRYSASGTRIFSVNCSSPEQAFFSYDGVTDIATFNNKCNGGDFADWAQSLTNHQVQDAFATAGATPVYGPSEIAALSAIGYQLVPEPATWSLAFGASAVALWARRRKRR
ncbi:MAG TPA: NF038122 family metalloprotease [Bryobacteraceae bacterium]|nr:NF038122 family metalloprotease [Bryobacteraceae bacterium]